MYKYIYSFALEATVNLAALHVYSAAFADLKVDKRQTCMVNSKFSDQRSERFI